MLRIENGKHYICSNCKKAFTTPSLLDEAKLCLSCRSYVLRYEKKCSNCGNSNFSDNLNHFIDLENKKHNWTILLWCVVGGIAVPLTWLAGFPIIIVFFAGWQVIRGLKMATSAVRKERERTNVEQAYFVSKVRGRIEKKVVDHDKILLTTETVGIAQAVKGEIANAEKNLTQAIKLGSEGVEVRVALAYVQCLNRKPDEGIQTLSPILSSKYHDLSRFELGLCLQTRQLLPTTPELLVRHSPLPENDVQIGFWMASELLHGKDAKSAKIIFGALRDMRETPSISKQWTIIADCGYFLAKSRLGDDVTDEIIAWWEENKSQPESTTFALGYFKTYDSVDASAIPVYVEGFQRDPSDNQAAETLIDYYMDTQQIDQARKVAELASALADFNAMTIYKLAIAYSKLNEIDRAVTLLQKIRNSDNVPQNQVRLMLFRAYRNKGLPDLAMDALLEVENLNLRFKELYDYGCIFQQNNEAEYAMKCFSEIYRHNGQYQDVGQRLETLVGKSNG